MKILYPKAVFVYESKEFGQFFMCPDCLEFIEGDLCLECGQIYDISMDCKVFPSLKGGKLIANAHGESI